MKGSERSEERINAIQCLHMIGWVLHFLCARCIEWLFKPLSILQKLDESKRVDCRVRGVA